jgi:hypothetical protein
VLPAKAEREKAIPIEAASSPFNPKLCVIAMFSMFDDWPSMAFVHESPSLRNSPFHALALTGMLAAISCGNTPQ